MPAYYTRSWCAAACDLAAKNLYQQMEGSLWALEVVHVGVIKRAEEIDRVRVRVRVGGRASSYGGDRTRRVSGRVSALTCKRLCTHASSEVVRLARSTKALAIVGNHELAALRAHYNRQGGAKPDMEPYFAWTDELAPEVSYSSRWFEVCDPCVTYFTYFNARSLSRQPFL